MFDDTRCAVEGCDKRKYARSWCNPHYRRYLKHGDPLTTLRPHLAEGTFEERFWAKVDAMGVCWEWLAYKDKDGYGRFPVNGSGKAAHRVAYELLIGPIPARMQLDHLCRNHGCVYPLHLEPVTPRENTLRGVNAIPGGHHHHAQKTHCKNNHEFTPENTYIRNEKGKTARACRVCRREAVLRHHERKREAQREA